MTVVSVADALSVLGVGQNRTALLPAPTTLPAARHPLLRTLQFVIRLVPPAETLTSRESYSIQNAHVQTNSAIIGLQRLVLNCVREIHPETSAAFRYSDGLEVCRRRQFHPFLEAQSRQALYPDDMTTVSLLDHIFGRFRKFNSIPPARRLESGETGRLSLLNPFVECLPCSIQPGENTTTYLHRDCASELRVVIANAGEFLYLIKLRKGHR